MVIYSPLAVMCGMSFFDSSLDCFCCSCLFFHLELPALLSQETSVAE